VVKPKPRPRPNRPTRPRETGAPSFYSNIPASVLFRKRALIGTRRRSGRTESGPRR
jgi:hypothetical protein